MEKPSLFLFGKDGVKIFIRPGAEDHISTHKGVLNLNDLKDKDLGDVVRTHLGYPLVITRPSIRDAIMFGIKRKTQIVYPKDVGYILTRLSPFSGARILEIGTGSGAMTLAFAWLVGDRGKVYTLDKREEFLHLARENLKMFGLDHRVEFILSDLSEPPNIEEADMMFIDVKNPGEVFPSASKKLKPSAPFGMILPTFNQVKEILAMLKEEEATDIEVVEILERSYKINPERLRPKDRMVAHTGFLVFGRKGIA